MATLTTLVSFDGADGEDPRGGLIADAEGDLFGTTDTGGASDDGVVFEIANSGAGYASTPTTLLSFDYNDGIGAFPIGGLIADSSGDLFGTTSLSTYSEVFEIDKTSTGYASAPTVLANFGNLHGDQQPTGGLVADAAGDLFGTTDGASYDDCTVFEIAKTADGYASTPTVLANFASLDYFPAGGLIADTAGDLFGVLAGGGEANPYGAVYEVAKTSAGYAGTPTVLARFDGANGQEANATTGVTGLIADAVGDLFGTTYQGGANGYGVVFEIAKTSTGYASTPTDLANFDGTDGSNPNPGLVADPAGDLFGTTTNGGANGDGEIFEIARTDTGYASTPTVVASFGANELIPNGGLIFDDGYLYGTTGSPSGSNDGTVFEVGGVEDTIPPTLTIDDAIPLPDSTTQTLTGSIDVADAGRTISIYDGATPLGTASATAAGAWTATITLPASGPYVLTAQATDLAGNLGVSNAVDLATGGGQTLDFTPNNSADAASLYNTGGDWDSIYGEGGTVYLTSAQVESFDTAGAIDFAGGSGNAAAVYGTGASWDYVEGDDGLLVLTKANVELISGGGDAIYFEGASGNAVALYNTSVNYDTINGSNGEVVLTAAFAVVIGGGNAIYFEGATEDIVALYNTAGNWDAVNGSNGEVSLTNAFAEVIGGGDTAYFESVSANAAAFYDSGGVFDAVTGSNGEVVLTNAQVEVTDGGNSIYLEGASGNIAALYNTRGVFDGVTGSNGEVVLTNAQAEVVGGANSIYLEGASGNTAALYDTGGAADAVTGSNGLLVLTNTQATVIGSTDTMYLIGANTVTQNGMSDAFVFQPTIGEDTINGFASTDTMQFSASDFANFSALQSHTSQSGSSTVITLDASDSVTLNNVTATSLVATQFHFA